MSLMESTRNRNSIKESLELKLFWDSRKSEIISIEFEIEVNTAPTERRFWKTFVNSSSARISRSKQFKSIPSELTTPFPDFI